MTKILIVEDDPQLRQLLQSHIQKFFGYDHHRGFLPRSALLFLPGPLPLSSSPEEGDALNPNHRASGRGGLGC